MLTTIVVLAAPTPVNRSSERDWLNTLIVNAFENAGKLTAVASELAKSRLSRVIQLVAVECKPNQSTPAVADIVMPWK